MNREDVEALGLKVGDRVRMTLEVAVEIASGSEVLVRPSPGSWGMYLHSDFVASAEKIISPFKPGDVLLKPMTSTCVLLGETTFVNLDDGKSYPYGDEPIESRFSHEDYVKVEAE